jgi:hypothetical protein
MVLLECAELEPLCRAVARRSRVLLRTVPATAEWPEMLSARPLVVVLPLAVYERRPWTFDVLAERMTASLLVLDHTSTAPVVMERRITEMLAIALDLRAMAR